MADQEDARGGANRRRRLDDRVVPPHIHQRFFGDTNSNLDNKKPLDLRALIDILKKSKRVDMRELDLAVERYYAELPGWVAAQPAEAQNYYRGMQTIMKRVHLDRCSYFNQMLKGHSGSPECNRILDNLKMSEKEFTILQKRIQDLGGREWAIPDSFALPLQLLKKE